MKVDDITATIERALQSAGLNTATPLVEGIHRHIRNALASAGLTHAGAAHAAGDVIDVEARERPDSPEADDALREPDTAADSAADSGPDAPGSFTWHVHNGRAGSRRFKTYVPAACRGRSVPLIVMLHGCRQHAEDFATGTRMNRLADSHGFIVAYPEQPARANGSSCWNWFEPRDQRRDGGEPELIAGIVRQIVAQQCLAQGQVDTRRVFVAGLSAGAAMALILGHTHPETFAGIGVHSGLPYAVAHDVGSAFAAMSSGSARGSVPRTAARPAQSAPARSVPTIVFHGKRDHTVNVSNAEVIVAEALQGYEARHGAPLRASLPKRGTAGGREFSRTVYIDASVAGDGQVMLEDWRIDGLGHAWSGGSADGSFADSQGPDASAAMVEFFLRR
ncbi:MAG: PHB depolymerase family esterase [Rubrivivax sp.]